MLRRESPDLEPTFGIKFRFVRNNLLGRDLLDRVNANCFAPSFLAHAMQMNDGYAITDFEHVGLGCGFYHRRLNLGSGSPAILSFSWPGQKVLTSIFYAEFRRHYTRRRRVLNWAPVLIHLNGSEYLALWKNLTAMSCVMLLYG